MYSERNKMRLFAGWVIVVGLAALAIGISSVSNWIIVVAVAVVPPLVARALWRTPDQTISERIHDARR